MEFQPNYNKETPFRTFVHYFFFQINIVDKVDCETKWGPHVDYKSMLCADPPGYANCKVSEFSRNEITRREVRKKPIM